jgi:hypothetical protein
MAILILFPKISSSKILSPQVLFSTSFLPPETKYNVQILQDDDDEYKNF